MATTTFQFKIDSDIKRNFFAWCKSQAINPSEWLRQKIAEAIEEKSKTDAE